MLLRSKTTGFPVTPAPQHTSALTGAGVLRHLLHTGLLTLDDALDHGLSAIDASMSHRSVLVYVGDTPRFFAKQADPLRSGGRDLRSEARFHAQYAARAPLRDFVPRCRLFVDGGETLIMDAPDAATLELTTLLWATDGPPGASTAPAPSAGRSIMRRYGRAIADVHSVGATHLGPVPWLLQPIEPPSAHAGQTDTDPCLRFVTRIATEARYQAALRGARNHWNPTGLIHGDLRCANVLLQRNGDASALWLVDWELACHGDRAWDLAAVIAELLTTAVLWHPTPDPWAAVVRSGIPLFSAYGEVWLASGDEWRALMERLVPFVAVKLIQTLLEIGYGDTAGFSSAESQIVPWIDELFVPSTSLRLSLLDALARSEPP